MAGRPPGGALKPRVECAVARQSDDAEIRRLLRENPMGGSIALTFEREPEYFRGSNLAGGRDQTILVLSNDRLACVGRCTRRACWVNGVRMTAGYLAELRMDQSARGHGLLLRRGYEFFRSIECTAPADVYFTAIASDNLRARHVLEAGMRGLPKYDFLAEIATVLIPVQNRRSLNKEFRVETGSDDSAPRIVEWLNSQGRNLQFAPFWDEPTLLGMKKQQLPHDRFHLLYRGGELIGCAGLWDQRSFRQTVIKSYAPILRVLRPFLNVGAALFGGGRLPSTRSAIPQAFLSPLACAGEDGAALCALIDSFFPTASRDGLQYLTLALPAADARIARLKSRYRARIWQSRIYQVTWEGLETVSLDREKRVLPDAALL